MGNAIDDDFLATMRAAAEECRQRAAALQAHRETCAERKLGQRCAECRSEHCVDCRVLTLDADPSNRCEPCKVMRARKEGIAGALASIPPRYALASFNESAFLGHVTDYRARAAGKQAAATRARSLVLLGAAGAGKTTLAVAMLRLVIDVALEPGCSPEALRDARRALFVTSIGLAKARGEHRLGGGEAPLVDRAMTASVLVVDDLGNEEDRYGTAVRDVINERHNFERPTWVTTFLEPGEVATRYGAGIARRLYEERPPIRVSR